jgi:hypothetical protein
MMKSRAALAAFLLLPALSSCAATTDQLAVGSPAEAPNSSPPPITFEINWDDPLAEDNGEITTTERMPEVAQRRLQIRPQVPAFGQDAKRVRVAGSPGPGRGTVALTYEFPKGDEFPGDGRVRVLISAADITVQDLDVMATDVYPGMTYDRFRAGSLEGILLSANGIGRAILVGGGLKYDVTGPAASPNAVRRLANKL